MSIIYKPSGPALEYAPLAANLFMGCGHGCRYCYAPSAVRKKRDMFHLKPQPKKDALRRFKTDAARLNGDDRGILLSFATDPYQPIEQETRLTRKAIRVLVKKELPFSILTKGGMRAARDFDVLGDAWNAWFGTSLVWTREKDAQYWEPQAASVRDRIRAIEEAHYMGIKTWVSLEPVIDGDQALELIEELHSIVDHWKVGKINHNKDLEKAEDWSMFHLCVTALLDDLGADYYLKKSLEDI